MKVRHNLNVGLQRFQYIFQAASQKMAPNNLLHIYSVFTLLITHADITTCSHYEGFKTYNKQDPDHSNLSSSTKDMNKLHFSFEPIHCNKTVLIRTNTTLLRRHYNSRKNFPKLKSLHSKIHFSTCLLMQFLPSQDSKFMSRCLLLMESQDKLSFLKKNSHTRLSIF